MAKRYMVAVPGTQAGASFESHDRVRFEQEVVQPVRSFLERAGDICPVLLFFVGGGGPDCEAVRPDETRPGEEGLPYHPMTPGSSIALEYFGAEKESGRMQVLVLTGGPTLQEHTARLVSMMNGQAATDVRILAPARLGELADELTTAVV